MMWTAGIIAAMSSITYPAISAYVSNYSDADKQGLAQGMITGMRGLCSGLGPALYGFIFYLFNVDLNTNMQVITKFPEKYSQDYIKSNISHHVVSIPDNEFVPGPPFVFGALLVLLAILVTAFIPELTQYSHGNNSSNGKKSSSQYKDRSSQYYYTSVQHQHNDTQCIGMTNDGRASGDNEEDIDNQTLLSTKRLNDNIKFEMHKRGTVNLEAQLPLMKDIEPL